VAKAKTVELSPEVGQKLAQWQQAQRQLDEVKAAEFALRNEIIIKAGFDPAKLDGTESLDIGQGWKLKAKKNLSYKLTNKEGETVALQTAIGTIANRPEIATNLVRWEPVLAEKLYKDEFLPLLAQFPQLAEIVAKALTVKPGAPQLELVPPEPEKA
jgi:hypothetical protein